MPAAESSSFNSGDRSGQDGSLTLIRGTSRLLNFMLSCLYSEESTWKGDFSRAHGRIIITAKVVKPVLYVTQDPSLLGEILRGLLESELEGKINFSVSTLAIEVSSKKLSLPYTTPT